MAGDVGTLNNLAAERTAVYQARPRPVETSDRRASTAVERESGPSEGLSLSDNARAELDGTRERGPVNSPPPQREEEEPQSRNGAADASELLRQELGKPREEQDAGRIQQLIADIQQELNGEPQGNDPAAQYRSETKQPLEGYDQTKLDNPNHRTPKYIFGRVAQDFQLDSVKGDKKNAETLLKAMVPELKAAGLEVVGVEGDRIQVKTEVGYEWVDVIRGAGGDDPGWWWGSEGVGTQQPTSSSKEWAAQTGQNTGGGGAAPMMGGAPPSGPKGPPILGSQIDHGKVMAILQKYPPTNEGIRAALPELQQHFPGVTILEHPKRLDKLQFPNGAIVDVIVGSGGPEPKWGWMPEN